MQVAVKMKSISNTSKPGKLQKFLAGIWANKLLLAGLIIITISLLLAIFAPFLSASDPMTANPAERLKKPFADARHILGVDYIGRDMLSRVLYGLRTSMGIGIASVVVALIIGVIMGMISGFFQPGPLDALLMRITDIQMGFPFIVLAIIALSLVEPNPVSITIVLSLSTWPAYARIIRSNVMQQKNMDYVSVGRIMGASKLRIALKYIGKNLLPAILPVIPLDIAGMIINESLLSYMQLGIKPPDISLGNIMADGRNYIATDWWIIGIPGIVIMLLVLGLNFVGDSLQTKLDPRLKQ